MHLTGGGEGGVAPTYPRCTAANVAGLDNNTVSTLFVYLVKVSPWLGHLDSTGLSFTLAWALGLYWAFKLGSLKGSMISTHDRMPSKMAVKAD